MGTEQIALGWVSDTASRASVGMVVGVAATAAIFVLLIGVNAMIEFLVKHRDQREVAAILRRKRLEASLMTSTEELRGRSRLDRMDAARYNFPVPPPLDLEKVARQARDAVDEGRS